MTLLQHIVILAVIALLAAGQLLFRKAAIAAPPLSSVSGLLALLSNPVFILALGIYGAATLLWVGVLQQVPLSRAYSFMALSFVIVPVASMLLFGEAITPRLIIGIVLVFAGLLLIGTKS